MYLIELIFRRANNNEIVRIKCSQPNKSIRHIIRAIIHVQFHLKRSLLVRCQVDRANNCLSIRLLLHGSFRCVFATRKFKNKSKVINCSSATKITEIMWNIINKCSNNWSQLYFLPSIYGNSRKNSLNSEPTELCVLYCAADVPRPI